MTQHISHYPSRLTRRAMGCKCLETWAALCLYFPLLCKGPLFANTCLALCCSHPAFPVHVGSRAQHGRDGVSLSCCPVVPAHWGAAHLGLLLLLSPRVWLSHTNEKYVCLVWPDQGLVLVCHVYLLRPARQSRVSCHTNWTKPHCLAIERVLAPVFCPTCCLHSLLDELMYWNSHM